MSDAISKLRLSPNQVSVLRQMRDCGTIRINDGHPIIWDVAQALERSGFVRIKRAPDNSYADISITEAGRNVAG